MAWMVYMVSYHQNYAKWIVRNRRKNHLLRLAYNNFAWARSIPGKNGRPAPYSPQLRESNFDYVKNDNKFKFVVQCYGNCDGKLLHYFILLTFHMAQRYEFMTFCSHHCQNILQFLDHMDSGFGDCEVINYCTAKKENATVGYKLYAGKVWYKRYLPILY